jgi:hypothetical protein
MEVQGQVDRFTRIAYAKRKSKEADAEWEANQNDGPESAEKTDRSRAILMKKLCAQRATETGEDFDKLYQFVSSESGI